MDALCECQEGRASSDDEDVAAARTSVNWQGVEVRSDRIRLLGKHTAITLNGIAQGFATDCAAAALAWFGVRHAR